MSELTKHIREQDMNDESRRLQEARDGTAAWKKWGPYLSERQWGTVREDYSPGGDAWNFFTHDHARSRAYRWGEDGLAGISDDQQHLCFALALWNGKDPILKERLFGLTNSEGNHGEDVKEYYFYLDSTPTHSYMKYLYKYPQAAYPYADLVETNGGAPATRWSMNCSTPVSSRTIVTSTSSWSMPKPARKTSWCGSQRSTGGRNSRAAYLADTVVSQRLGRWIAPSNRAAENILDHPKRAKDESDPFRLMGFGYRVYKTNDPRAKIMRKALHEVLETVGRHHRDDPLFKVAVELERVALSDDYFVEKRLNANPRLLFGDNVEGARFPDRDVHRAVRDRPHGGLDCALEGDDLRSLAAHRQAAPALYWRNRTHLRADGGSILVVC